MAQSAVGTGSPAGGGKAVHFEWDAGPLNGRGRRKWRTYDAESAPRLAGSLAAQSGRGAVELHVDGFFYTVDFDLMHQVAGHSGAMRKIRFAV